MDITIFSSSAPSWLAPLATFFAAGVALFIALGADRLKKQWFPPKLVVELENARGVLVPGGPDRFDIRWYHLRIRNLDPVSAATDVRAYMQKLEESRQGTFVTLWEEPIPLSLRHEASFTPRRQVGQRPIDTDFFAVVDRQKQNLPPLLEFRVIRAPFNANVAFVGPVHLRATVFTDSVETNSALFTFDIHWDGTWSPGTDEMASNLRITVPKLA